MPAITLVNRSRLEGSGIIGEEEEGASRRRIWSCRDEWDNRDHRQQGKPWGMLAAARSAAGAKEAGAISARMVSGILYL